MHSLRILKDNKLSGYHLIRALRDDIFNNPNRNIYSATLERISLYSAGTTPLPDALLHLDSLWAMLPVELQPTDSAKCLQLRHSLDSDYAAIVKTACIAKPNASYDSVCESLMAEFRSQEVLRLKKSTLETDTAAIAAAAPPPIASSVPQVVEDEAYYSDGSDDSYKYKRRNQRVSSYRTNNHRNRSRSRSRDRYRSSPYRGRGRSRSASPYRKLDNRHPAVSFRGGRRVSTPSYRGSPKRHSDSPLHRRGNYTSSEVQCAECHGWGHTARDNCPSRR